MTKGAGDQGLTAQQRRAKYRENQNYFSEKLSEVTRYVGFGLVAVAFGLLSQQSELSQKLSDRADNLVAFAGLCGCLVIFGDFLHLMLGWWSNSLAAENEAGGFTLTPRAKHLRRVQTAMFYAKQIAAIAGSLTLILAITTAISFGLLIARP